jgi:hypothetical protein
VVGKRIVKRIPEIGNREKLSGFAGSTFGIVDSLTPCDMCRARFTIRNQQLEIVLYKEDL